MTTLEEPLTLTEKIGEIIRNARNRKGWTNKDAIVEIRNKVPERGGGKIKLQISNYENGMYHLRMALALQPMNYTIFCAYVDALELSKEEKESIENFAEHISDFKFGLDIPYTPCASVHGTYRI